MAPAPTVYGRAGRGRRPVAVDPSRRMVVPYGLIYFEIRDMRPSGVAGVLIYPGPGTALLAHSWAKYGKIPNGTTTWYDFSYDEFTGTGAQTVSLGTPDEALSLTFVDGARGDDDGQRNGVIRDPGGPASFAHTVPSGALGLLVIGCGVVFVAQRRQLT